MIRKKVISEGKCRKWDKYEAAIEWTNNQCKSQ